MVFLNEEGQDTIRTMDKRTFFYSKNENITSYTGAQTDRKNGKIDLLFLSSVACRSSFVALLLLLTTSTKPSLAFCYLAGFRSDRRESNMEDFDEPQKNYMKEDHDSAMDPFGDFSEPAGSSMDHDQVNQVMDDDPVQAAVDPFGVNDYSEPAASASPFDTEPAASASPFDTDMNSPQADESEPVQQNVEEQEQASNPFDDFSQPSEQVESEPVQQGMEEVEQVEVEQEVEVEAEPEPARGLEQAPEEVEEQPAPATPPQEQEPAGDPFEQQNVEVEKEVEAEPEPAPEAQPALEDDVQEEVQAEPEETPAPPSPKAAPEENGWDEPMQQKFQEQEPAAQTNGPSTAAATSLQEEDFFTPAAETAAAPKEDEHTETEAPIKQHLAPGLREQDFMSAAAGSALLNHTNSKPLLEQSKVIEHPAPSKATKETSAPLQDEDITTEIDVKENGVKSLIVKSYTWRDVDWADTFWSCRPCFLAGLPVHISWIYLSIFVLDMLRGCMFKGDNRVIWVLLFWLGDLFLIFSSLLHEFAHIYATKRLGGRPDHILLWPLGGYGYTGHGGGALTEAVIALAGPLSHIPIFVAFCLASGLGPGLSLNLFNLQSPIHLKMGENLINLIASQQLLLIIYNLFLPVYPLDGGRMFTSLLLPYANEDKVAKAIIGITAPLGLGLFIWFWVGFGLSLSAFIGIWMMYQAFHIYKHRKACTLGEMPLFAGARGQSAGSLNKEGIMESGGVASDEYVEGPSSDEFTEDRMSSLIN
eukprot:g10166.t1